MTLVRGTPPPFPNTKREVPPSLCYHPYLALHYMNLNHKDLYAMPQLHRLQSQLSRLQDMLDNKQGCAPCLEKSIQDVKTRIEALQKKEAVNARR